MACFDLPYILSGLLAIATFLNGDLGARKRWDLCRVPGAFKCFIF